MVTDMVERYVEVFIYDILVFGVSFDECLEYLDVVLARYVEKKLVLDWEKCYFMVREGIVLRLNISKAWIEADKANIKAIEKLPPSLSVKGVRSFLGHDRFYHSFIKDFFYIVTHVQVTGKNVTFSFDEFFYQAFEELKKRLVFAPIIITSVTRPTLGI